MTQTLTKRASALDHIDAMLQRVSSAREKGAAEANTEAGGYQGETTHPVKDVDDRTEDAQEGNRSAENTSDVKDDQGSTSVDSTAPGTPGGQDSAQLNIGTNQSATGEDSAVETESAKGGKDDPGTQRGETAHPARTDNDALDGHKYAAAAKAVLQKIAAAKESGDALLADLATAANQDVRDKAAQLQKGAEPTTAGDPSGDSATPDSEPEAKHPPGKGGNKKEAEKAADAGYDLAAAIAAGGMVQGQQKQAQDEMVFGSLEETVQESFDRAIKTASFLAAYNEERAKQAEDEEGEEEEEDEGAEGGESANPLEAAGDMGGDPGAAPMGSDEDAALLAALNGGGDIGGEQALEGMGGGAELPPEAGMAPPAGAEGGGMPPEGGMGGEMGGLGGISEEDLAMLLAALQQAQMTPEGFEAKAAAHAAKALKEKVASGQKLPDWKPKTAEQAQQLQRLVNYVKEVAAS